MRANIIILSILSASLFACSPNDFDTEKTPEASAFAGKIETSGDVDLGLKARWAGFNVGADAPEQYGDFYAWGETEPKDAYSESNYTSLPAGTVLAGESDVATMEMGYGYQMPSPEDVQELIDNCDITFCSYNGVNGWAATSRVPGFEGKSIFFPAAGYMAEQNVNYQDSYAVFWTNEQTAESNGRIKNAFFKENSLNLNIPPKGAGGLAWCGYSVRAVRKFRLVATTTAASASMEQTSVKFFISGNAKWNASVSGTGVTVSPSSGEGDAELTVNFPVNNTEDTRTYTVTVSSEDLAEPLLLTVTHYGITPEFKIDGAASENILWDGVNASCSLKASASVSWTASVSVNGHPAEGASISPASGQGSFSGFSVTLPKSSIIRGKTRYSVDFVTTDSRIPSEYSKVSYLVYQDACPMVPFNDTTVVLGKEAYDELLAAFPSLTISAPFTVDNVTITPSASILITGTYPEIYMYKKGNYSFTSASSGDAVLVLYCSVYRGKSLALTWRDKNGTAKDVPSSVIDKLKNSGTSDAYYNKDNTALNLELPGVEEGDVISIVYSGTDAKNQRMYRFLWKENQQ